MAFSLASVQVVGSAHSVWYARPCTIEPDAGYWVVAWVIVRPTICKLNPRPNPSHCHSYFFSFFFFGPHTYGGLDTFWSAVDSGSCYRNNSLRVGKNMT
jgi:hypothetical protein